METLEEAIFSLEPNFDLLHECLGLGIFIELAITSDGYFLGRASGECGFNHFLGTPSRQALERTSSLFKKLSTEHQHELIARLRLRGIPPEAVGIPELRN